MHHGHGHPMTDSSNNTLMRQWAMLRHIPTPPRRTEVAELVRRLAEDGFETSGRTVERDWHRQTAVLDLAVRCR